MKRNYRTIFRDWLIAHHPFHRPKSGPRILCFHDIQDQAAFEARMVWLKQYYRFLSLEALLSTKAENSLALTFDDAYESWVDRVLPVLEKYEIPATFFINSGLIGLRGSAQAQYYTEKCRRASEGLRALSTEGFQKLAAHPLCEIGGHTRDHFLFSSTTDMQSIEVQIVEDKQRLERQSGSQLKYFAYPFGQLIHAPERVQDVVKKAGYEYAFTIVPGFVKSAHSPYLVSRDSLELFQSKKVWKRWLEGAYDSIVQQKQAGYRLFNIPYR